MFHQIIHSRNRTPFSPLLPSNVPPRLCWGFFYGQNNPQGTLIPKMHDEKQRPKKVMPVSPGRPKGVPNKTTQTAKDAIAMAADRLGGTDRLVAWAQEDPANERAFWTAIYPKLLPLQVTGPGANGEHMFTGIRVEFVKPNASS